MVDEGLDGAGGERIVLEQDFGVDGIEELDQAARSAGVGFERIEFLAGDGVLVGEEAAGEGHGSEVQDGMQVRAIAGAAMSSHEGISCFRNAGKAEVKAVPAFV